MKHNLVQEKSFELAVSIVRFTRHLEERKEYAISRQLIRSGTSIGANIEEAIGAESRKDFAHKLLIARKEARETRFWLKLLQAADNNHATQIIDLLALTEDILNLLHRITKTLKNQPPLDRPKS
jgi:four helix bundle protein